MRKLNNPFKRIFLTFSLLMLLSGYIYGSIQTTYTVNGNEVIVFMKSDADLITQTFYSFGVDFRYAIADNPFFFVTSSSISTVGKFDAFDDPNNAAYKIQRFGFVAGTGTTALTNGVEKEVFRFRIIGGSETGTIGLVSEDDAYAALTFYEFKLDGDFFDLTNYATPFYGPNVTTYTGDIDGYTWDYLPATVNLLGKSWKTSGTTNEWSVGSNWNDETAPLSTDAVTILPGSTQPIISSNVVCAVVLVKTGASLEIATNGSLTSDIENQAGNTGLVIRSGASGTGSLIQTKSGASATVERYITGSSNLSAMKYHLVSRPFSEDYTSNSWLGSYLYSFDEATYSWIPNGIGINDPLSATSGYLIYYPGDNTLYTHTGTLKANTSIIPLSFGSHPDHPGCNLIPNMYTSALDFNANGWTGNISNKIYLFNSTNGNYGEFIKSDVGTNNVTNIIPMGQSFFVEALSAGNLSISPTARVIDAKPFLKSSNIATNLLRLKANGNNYSDEIIVRFRFDATTGYDAQMESKKMLGLSDAPQLSSVADGNAQLSINSLPLNQSDVVVPLNFSLNATTDVTFDASGMDSFIGSIPIYLEDLELNKVVDLRTDPVYTFSHTSGSANNRFVIRFMGVTGTPEQLEAKGNVFISNGKLFVDVPSMNQSEVTVGVYDALGRQLISNKMVINGVTEITSPSATGVYIVRVIGGNKTFAGKVFVN